MLRRRPLLFPTPLHGLWSGARFGEFFDIERWSTSLEVPVVEWADIKLDAAARPLVDRTEDLFCWGTENISSWTDASLLPSYGVSTIFLPPDSAVGRSWAGIQKHASRAPSPRALAMSHGALAFQNVVCLGRDLSDPEWVVGPPSNNPSLLLATDPVRPFCRLRARGFQRLTQSIHTDLENGGPTPSLHASSPPPCRAGSC